MTFHDAPALYDSRGGALTPTLFLSRHSREVRALANALRRLVKQVVPEVNERVYPGWNILGCRVRAGKREVYFAYISPHPEYVTIGFRYGAILADPAALLENENLKQVRFVSIRRPAQIRRPALAALIREAAEAARLPKPMREWMLVVAQQRLSENETV